MSFKTKENLKALIYYSLLIAVFYSPVVFMGKTLLPSLYQRSALANGVETSGIKSRTPVNSFNVDIATPAYYESPINKLVGDQIKALTPPLWNPYQGAGTPLLAQYSTRALFPLQILEDISPPWSWDFFMLARLLIAGFFTFLFLRAIGLAFVPAFLGGVFYIFSGSFVWFINLEQMTNVAMMVPVMMLAAQGLARVRAWSRTFLFAISFALVLLAGQPEVALYLSLLVVSYYIFMLIYYKTLGPARTVRHGLKDLVIALIVGLFLAAPLIVPFLELWANAYHIHQAGGIMGSQALPIWSRILPVLTPSATTIIQDPSMLAGLCPTVAYGETVFRYLPVNGVWDSLGGYLGVLPILLALSGMLATIRWARVVWKGPLFFFFAFALFILFKNMGFRPFIYLGSLPLFDQVWSLRWAGPVWTFSLAVAGSIGFQALLPIASEAREGEMTAPQTAPHPFLMKVNRYLNAKPHVPAVAAFFVITLFYFIFALGPTLMLVIRSKEVFNATMEPFALPAIGASVLVFFIILLAGLILASFLARRRPGQVGPSAMVFLAVLELWWAVPRGYSPHWLLYKFYPFAIGLLVVVLFYKRLRVLGFIFAIAFALGALYLDTTAVSGLPERSDPFEAPAYVDFLKSRQGRFRVAGSYGMLMPNYASSLALEDVHYVNALITSTFHNLRTRYLHADIIEEEPVSSLWFTGRPERCEVLDDYKGRNMASAGIYRQHYRPVEDDFLYGLKGYSLLGVKYFLMPKDVMMYEDFPLVYDREIKIFENPLVYERAFVVSDVGLAPSWKEAQEMVFKKGFDPSKIAVVETVGVIEELKTLRDDSASLKTSPVEKVRITQYTSTKVVVEVDSPRSAILVLSDSWYPGWSVRVNSKRAHGFRVDGALRGVLIGPGRSVVVWRYWPWTFRVGTELSGATMIVCFAIFLWIRSKEDEDAT